MWYLNNVLYWKDRHRFECADWSIFVITLEKFEFIYVSDIHITTITLVGKPCWFVTL